MQLIYVHLYANNLYTFIRKLYAIICIYKQIICIICKLCTFISKLYAFICKLYAFICKLYAFICKLYFRLVRQITLELEGKSYRWNTSALQALQEGSEHHVIKILNSANLCAIHAGRVTLMPKDIQLAGKLLDVDSKYKIHQIVTGAEGYMEKRGMRQKKLEEIKKKQGEVIRVVTRLKVPMMMRMEEEVIGLLQELVV